MIVHFQPWSIAKLIGNRGFTDRYIMMLKSDSSLSGPLYTLRFADTLRDSTSFCKLTSFKIVTFYIASNFVLNTLTGRIKA